MPLLSSASLAESSSSSPGDRTISVRDGVLDLRRRDVTYLGLPHPLLHVHTLLLDDNPIPSLSSTSLEQLPSLRVLSACHTELHNLWTTMTALKAVPGLEELYLCRVPQLTTRSDTFAGPFDPRAIFMRILLSVRGRNHGEIEGTSTSPWSSMTRQEWTAFLQQQPRHYLANTTDLCHIPHYWEFLVHHLKGLRVLDGWPVTQEERIVAEEVFHQFFEEFANRAPSKESCPRILMAREMGLRPLQCRTRSPKWAYTMPRSRETVVQRMFVSALFGEHTFPHVSGLPVSPSFRPRQFEYHPSIPGYMVFGTLDGEVVVLNCANGHIVGRVTSEAMHSVLGLCWLHNDSSKFVAGSDTGVIRLYDVNRMRVDECGDREPMVYEYEQFDDLTSVHVNSTDDLFLASGYSCNVSLYELKTGRRLCEFVDLHTEHINVLKFSNFNPNIFASSSFDRDVKMWDLRQEIKQDRPIFTRQSQKGNIMVCFSPDDKYILSSAVDNEIHQYTAVDGAEEVTFDIRKLASDHNYTRSYYLNGRDYIISGSCEENVVRILCSRTGRFLRDVQIQPLNPHGYLYVQSLRGDPFNDFHFSVLVAYNHLNFPSEIFRVNMLTEADQIPVRETPAYHRFNNGHHM